MDEIDSKAFEEAKPYFERVYGAGMSRLGESWKCNAHDALTEFLRAYLAAPGLTSKLAALEDEITALRGYIADAPSTALEDENKTLREALRRIKSLPFPIRHASIVVGYYYLARDIASAALSKPASSPAEGKGESEAKTHSLAKFGSPDVAALGLYRIHWKSGGSSLAAIGMMENGDRWIAPTNWVRPSTMPSAGEWGEIERLEIIDPDATPPAPQPLEGAVKVKELPARFVEDYAEGYDFRFDNGGGYTPTEAERAMLIDFGHGLISELSLPPAPQPVGDVRDGWKLVPIEPTLFMQNAGWREVDKQGFQSEDTEVAPIYRAMLSASPSPAAQEDGI